MKLNFKSTAFWLTVDAVIIVAWKLIFPDKIIDPASVMAIVVSTVVISNTNGWQKKWLRSYSLPSWKPLNIVALQELF